MKKILLVDDERIIRKALSQNLKKSGYEVTTAASGEEATTCLQEQPYDLIVTDYIMGGINGVELTTKAKILYPKLKVIIFSGCIDHNADELFNNSADCFLTKPISLDDLLDNIEVLLKE